MYQADQQPLAHGVKSDATMKTPAFSRASLAHHTLLPLISVRCHEISLLNSRTGFDTYSRSVLAAYYCLSTYKTRLSERVSYEASGRSEVLVTSRLHRPLLRHHGNESIGRLSVRDEKSIKQCL